MEIEEIRSVLKGKKQVNPINIRGALGTGSTRLNLACTDTATGAIPKGCYVLVVGDSASGKTWIIMSIFAEAANSKKFKDHKLVFDGPENGALMNLEKYFGSKMAARLEPPAGTQEEPHYSSTTEELYYRLDELQKLNIPFIYVLDSMDVLTTEEEEAVHTAHSKMTFEGAKKGKGTMGTSKAKINSARLRVIVNKLKETGSILIIISQTRDNIGFGAQFNPKTRSGGTALRFYAHLEFWTSIREKIKKTVRGKPVTIGIKSLIKIKKNRITGKERSVEVPLYYSVGIDDLGANVEYLVENKVWKKGGQGIINSPYGNLPFDALIAKIEEEGHEKQVQSYVADCWNEIEELSVVKRKPRYT